MSLISDRFPKIGDDEVAFQELVATYRRPIYNPVQAAVLSKMPMTSRRRYFKGLRHDVSKDSMLYLPLSHSS